MGNPIISGGDGSNGKVSVRGKDGTPLVELVAADNEGAIGAGNKDRPGRLTMFNGAGKMTANLTAASATLVLGDNDVNGKVSIRGKDGTPLAELVGADNEAAIGAGNKGRPGRLKMFSGDAEQTVNLTAADATLVLGGKKVSGKLSIRGSDGTPLAELVTTDKDAIIGAGNKNRPGQLKLFSSDAERTVNLTAEDATLSLGGNNGGKGRNGKVTVRSASDRPLVELIATDELADVGIGNLGHPSRLRMFNGEGQQTITLLSEEGGLFLGGSGRDSKLSMRSADDTPLVELSAFQDVADMGIGNKDRPGQLRMFSKEAKQTVGLTAEDATLVLGGGGRSGLLSVRGTDGTPLAEVVVSDAEAVIGAGNTGRAGRLRLFDIESNMNVNLSAQDATLTLGGSHNGLLSVRGSDGTPLAELVASDDGATIGVGNTNRPGRLNMFSSESNPTIGLTAEDATLVLGGNNRDGKVSLFGADNMPLIELVGGPNESVIGLGQLNRPGRIALFNGAQDKAIELNAADGDIWISNADCAEEFDLAQLDAEPGMVMVLTEEGRVIPGTAAYDSKVIGVASGAGTYRPGLILDRRETGLKRIAIALVGKVFCFVDATQEPVRVGDLLTTADRKGHAMRATDPQSAFGAVLGKALAPLESGCGLIPILVALQ